MYHKLDCNLYISTKKGKKACGIRCYKSREASFYGESGLNLVRYALVAQTTTSLSFGVGSGMKGNLLENTGFPSLLVVVPSPDIEVPILSGI